MRRAPHSGSPALRMPSTRRASTAGSLSGSALRDTLNGKAWIHPQRLRPFGVRFLHATQLGVSRRELYMGEEEVGTAADGPLIGNNCLLVALQRMERMTEPEDVQERIVRIEAHRLLDERHPFRRPAGHVQHVAQADMTLGVVRVERQATLRFRNGLLVLLAPQVDPAEEHVGERQFVVERHAFSRQLQGAIERVLVVTPPVPPLGATDFGKERVRRRELRIERDRPFEVRAGLCGALSRPPPEPIPRLQEQIVGLEVLGVAALDARSLARGQMDLQRGDDGVRDLVLEVEDVSKSRS